MLMVLMLTTTPDECLTTNALTTPLPLPTARAKATRWLSCWDESRGRSGKEV